MTMQDIGIFLSFKMYNVFGDRNPTKRTELGLTHFVP